MALDLKPLMTHPELLRLLEKAREQWEWMTPELLRLLEEQRKSWARQDMD